MWLHSAAVGWGNVDSGRMTTSQQGLALGEQKCKFWWPASFLYHAVLVLTVQMSKLRHSRGKESLSQGKGAAWWSWWDLHLQLLQASSPTSCFCSWDPESRKNQLISRTVTESQEFCENNSLSIRSGVACAVKDIFKAKRSSFCREPHFVFFVRLKPHVTEENVVGIISRNGWYKSKEKNNSSTLKQLI